MCMNIALCTRYTIVVVAFCVWDGSCSPILIAIEWFVAFTQNIFDGEPHICRWAIWFNRIFKIWDIQCYVMAMEFSLCIFSSITLPFSTKQTKKCLRHKLKKFHVLNRRVIAVVIIVEKCIKTYSAHESYHWVKYAVIVHTYLLLHQLYKNRWFMTSHVDGEQWQFVNADSLVESVLVVIFWGRSWPWIHSSQSRLLTKTTTTKTATTKIKINQRMRQCKYNGIRDSNVLYWYICTPYTHTLCELLLFLHSFHSFMPFRIINKWWIYNDNFVLYLMIANDIRMQCKCLSRGYFEPMQNKKSKTTTKGKKRK